MIESLLWLSCGTVSVIWFSCSLRRNFPSGSFDFAGLVLTGILALAIFALGPISLVLLVIGWVVAP
jgi:hypothetical protein